MEGWRRASKDDSKDVKKEDDGGKSRGIRMRYRLGECDRGVLGSQILLLF